MFKKRIALATGTAVLVMLWAVVSSSSADHSILERISTGPSNGNGSSSASFAGASADGTRVFFTTSEQLEPGDTDSSIDLYERSGGTTTRISTGPSGGNDPNEAFEPVFAGASADGTRVFFSTPESLEPNDSDGLRDLYERSGETTTRISTGPSGGNSYVGPFNPSFAGASANGTRVFFTTAERLEPGDTDSSTDLYERSGGTTTRISTGPSGGNGAFDASFAGASANGTRVFFITSEQLETGDTDSSPDIYERSGGTTTRISTGPNPGIPVGASFAGASADGTRVRFATTAQLEPGDTDSSTDLYERSDGTTTRISTGPSGGNGAFGASFAGASADGTRVFFITSEQLETGDTDSSPDIYERSGGTTTRISTGPSGGNGAFSAFFAGASADGTRVFFRTDERLEPGDTDSVQDIYERSGGTTTRISTGPSGNDAASAASATFARASADGTRVFFTTSEPLEPADTDSQTDVYERSGGTTTRISTGPSGGNGAFSAFFAGASADGTRVFFQTAERLASQDLDVFNDVYVARLAVTTGYPRPKAATPVRVPLVPAYEECSETTTTHAPPLAFGSCNPPELISEQLTVGSPDANGAPAKSVGFVSIVAHPGVPGGADDADAALIVDLQDVRNQGTLSDYTGELRLEITLRISDRANGGAQNLPATVVDLPLVAAVPCTATGDTTVGSSCSLSTSLDTLLGPSATPEGKRAIYGVQDVGVMDGGPDGDADTTLGNTLFASHGFFIP